MHRLILALSWLVLSSTAAAMSFDTASYHYSGSVTIDDESGHIDADWQIAVLDPEQTEVTMLLRETLSGVLVEGGAVAGFSSRLQEGFGPFLATTITLNPAETDAPRSFRMRYSGVLLPEPLENRINAIEPGRIELNVDSFWHPIDAGFNRALTADFTVRLGDGWQGVGFGTVTPENGGYRVQLDEPSVDIAFSLSKEFTVTKAGGFTIYDQRPDPAGTGRLVEAAGQCLSFLNERFGRETPLPVAKLLITDRPSSGYSRKSYIVFTDIAETKRGPLTRFVCHEFAHNWSYGKFDTVENWINEAFAEYIGLMAVRHFLGEDEYQAMLAQFREQLEGKQLPHIWKAGDSQRGPYLVQYRKGPLVLAELEAQIGADAFLAWVQRFFAGRGSTTPALLDTLEAVAGAAARQSFEARLGE